MIFNLFALASVVSAEVIELTSDNFETTVFQEGGSPWLISFYSASCPHSQIFAPKFLEASNLVSGVNFGQIESQYVNLFDEYNVEFYPTLFVFDEFGNASVFDQPYETVNLVEFANTLI